MARLSLLLLACAASACSKDTANTATPGGSGSMAGQQQKILITVNHNILTAIIYDNPVSRSFLSQMPLTVDMADFARTEKIFYPPQNLSTGNTPGGLKPIAGDIALYAPWGNIALFYRGGDSFSDRLIPVGHIVDGDIEAFNTYGDLNGVRFELARNRKQYTP